MSGARRIHRTPVLVIVMLVSVLAPAAASAAVEMQPPTVRIRRSQASATAVPLNVSWMVAPDTGSAVERYSLERAVDGGAWVAVPLAGALSRSVGLRLRPWRSHQFRVRARYADGSVTDWAASNPLWLAHAQEDDSAITYHGSWQTVPDTEAEMGARRSSVTPGDSVSFTFSGTHAAWITRLGPDRGQARVYVDDELQATVDLRRARTRNRQIAFRSSWPEAAVRTLRIELVGTDDRPGVDIDAFVTGGPPSSATLVGAGDIGRCTSPGDELTAELIQAIDGIVYTTGDNAYPDGTATDFANCYSPSWGAFRTRTRPSPGNHDYVTAGAAPYYGYFGANAGPAGRGFYTYQAGTWRIYSLNSEACRAANDWCAPGTAQYEWLRADLTVSRQRCVLAYWHRPRFSSGYHGGSARMATITQLLYERGAEVVLAGHDHSYERFEPLAADGQPDPVRGIRHFVVGTGGAALYAFDRPPLASTATRQAHTHGVLRLELRAGAYDWAFVPTTEGTYSDSGSGTCH